MVAMRERAEQYLRSLFTEWLIEKIRESGSRQKRMRNIIDIFDLEVC